MIILKQYKRTFHINYYKVKDFEEKFGYEFNRNGAIIPCWIRMYIHNEIYKNTPISDYEKFNSLAKSNELIFSCFDDKQLHKYNLFLDNTKNNEIIIENLEYMYILKCGYYYHNIVENYYYYSFGDYQYYKEKLGTEIGSSCE